jgi:hypothetical protein
MLLLVLSLASCAIPLQTGQTTIDPGVISTAAAKTVVAMLSEGAGQMTTEAETMTPVPPTTAQLPTETQPDGTTLPTGSPSPTSTTKPAYVACDAALFVADVTIPDGSKFDKGEKFVKTWRINNVGSCLWNANYFLEFDSGVAMDGLASIPFPAKLIQPGESIDLSVELKAPMEDGRFRGYWGIKNQEGAWVPVTGGTNSKTFYVEIAVGTGVPKYTDSPGEFAVTKVAFEVVRTGACADVGGKYTVTGTITANKAGTVTYRWKRSDGATGPALDGSVVFLAAGKKSVSFEWITSATDLWMDLYIDEPNHQLFKRAVLTCG